MMEIQAATSVPFLFTPASYRLLVRQSRVSLARGLLA